MNYNAMTETEARYTLFAFKKCLRDWGAITPDMLQFYENGIKVLSEKIPRLEKDGKDPRPYGDKERDRNAQVQSAWTNN